MPVTAEQLATASKSSLDLHLKNKPIDQIAVERPLLKRLNAKKKSFPGAKEYVVEQLRKSYDSNFQWYSGDDEVTFSLKDTLEQAKYRWSSCHDGYSINEDECTRNGIILTDESSAQATAAEAIALTNLLDEKNEALRLGYDEKLDFELHTDGTSDVDAVMGLDGLISLNPTVGTVGGLDRAVFTWWRNYYKTGLVVGDILDEMEKAWRRCVRNGGKPNFILVGESFLDLFRTAALSATGGIQRFITSVGSDKLDPSVSDLAFHGVPLTWDPVFEDLDAALAPAIAWQKRCYMLNDNFIRMRPAQGHDQVTRKPPRVYNRYTHYTGLTSKLALTCSRMNAHAALSIA